MPIVLSTVGTPERDRFEYWLHGVSNTFVPVQCIPTDDTPVITSRRPVPKFDGQIRAASLGPILATDVMVTPHLVRRGGGEIRESNGDYFKFSLQLQGSCGVAQGDRQTVLRPGDIILYDTTRPYSLTLSAGYRGLVLLIPRNQLHIKPAHLDNVLCSPLGEDHCVTRILTNLLREVTDDIDGIGQDDPWISQHIVDLINCLLSRRAGLAPRLIDIQDTAHPWMINEYIREHISDRELSVERVAKAFGVSTRQVHKIYESTPDTVGQLIRDHRLDMCWNDLRNPRLNRFSISALARKWGFDNPSSFSRAFRRRYGITARQCRAGQSDR